MDESYRIEAVDDPEKSVWGVIGHSLQAFNVAKVGDSAFARVCYALKAPDESIVGGVLGEVYWGWLFVDLLSVREDLRGQGYGHRLLNLVEEAGRQRGAKHAYLDTFSFQAPEFYRKHGYAVFGTLEDFPPGHRRFFLKKQL
ncbi:MAG: GNAT family N-acetyltransferase [Chloroflexi bacterium]|nr:GNAT family N-acetyltransferase [Chloroflexota bacterium]